MGKRQYSRRPLGYATWQPFLDLPSSAQNLYGWLVTMENISQAGVLPIQLRRWSRLSADGSAGKVEKDLAVLARHGFVVVDEDREELLVVPFIADDKLGNRAAERGAIEQCQRESRLFWPFLANQLRGSLSRFHDDNQDFAERMAEFLDARRDGLPEVDRRSTDGQPEPCSSSGSGSGSSLSDEKIFDSEVEAGVHDDDPWGQS